MQISVEQLVALDGVGRAKAEAILATAPTISDVLNLNPEVDAEKIPGVSSTLLTSVIGWAAQEMIKQTDASGAESSQDEQSPPGLGDVLEVDGLAVSSKPTQQEQRDALIPELEPTPSVREVAPFLDHGIIYRTDS